ncbi:MAG TPA: phosphopantetheine-binding protein [Jatrophihabitans sp.]|nr:phosphopantetheine-binding protein [Jatrophihabitans sp.]
MSELTRNFLLEVLSEDLNLHPAELPDDLLLGSGGLGMESLSYVELGMHAHRRLGIQIPDPDLDQIASYTVGELLDYLDARLGERETA